MRYLTKPKVKDLSNLENLRASTAASAIAVTAQIPVVKSRYKEYLRAKGNPWKINTATSLAALKDDFKYLYTKEPVALSFISKQRREMVGACPMCGRDALGTLDHYLPKSLYYEFSFFSRNLVPACYQCNVPRQTAYKGVNSRQRPIHCYYDKIAGQRIMTVNISGDWRAPNIRPVSYNLTGGEKDMVDWHIQNIVIPSGFMEYVANLWGSLVNSPSIIIGNDRDINKIALELERLELVDQTQQHTPNSWKSCFYHGLRSSMPALNYLATLI